MPLCLKHYLKKNRCKFVWNSVSGRVYKKKRLNLTFTQEKKKKILMKICNKKEYSYCRNNWFFYVIFLVPPLWERINFENFFWKNYCSYFFKTPKKQNQVEKSQYLTHMSYIWVHVLFHKYISFHFVGIGDQIRLIHTISPNKGTSLIYGDLFYNLIISSSDQLEISLVVNYTSIHQS